MVGAGHAAYTDRYMGWWQQWSQRLQKAMQISGALTDEAVKNGSIKKVEKRRNVREPSKDKNGRNANKRTRNRNVFATTINPVGRENAGAWPECTTCNSYHAPRGPCCTFFNYNRPGHLVDDLNGQGNDQGMGANRGIEGVNRNIEGANRGALDFSMIIAQQLQNLLPAMLAKVGNQGNVGNQNGCSYKEVLACNPKEYDGKGGVVVLTQWIEKIENVQDISGCSIDQKVKYTVGSFVEEFYPSHEIQKLETELWNHAMVGAGHAAYTDRFHKLVSQSCYGFYCNSCICPQCEMTLFNGICNNCIYGDGKPLTCNECEGMLREQSREVFQVKGDLMKSIQTFLETFNCIPFEENPQILFRAWENFFAIQYSKPEDPNELFQKLLEDLKELAEYEKSQSRDRSIFLNDDSDQNKECFENSSDEIAASNPNQEKEEPPQDSNIHQLIEECSIKICEEQKQKDKRDCDVPDVCDNHSDIFSDSKIDDDISEDISQIQDVVLREKFLTIIRLISNIESLNDNSTPNRVLNSFEFDNSLLDNFSPEFETFCDYMKETRSVPRPPPEPPDAETDARKEISVVMNDKDEDVNYSSFIFVIFDKVFSFLS
nr:hypothetical protein [Tanacetum cinerariifolium]